MKKFTVMVAAALCLVSLGSVAGAEDKVTGDVYVGPTSKYVFRGVDLSEGRGVIQGGVDLSYKNFTLSYWTNYQIISGATLEAGNATETDLTLNYAYSPVDLLTFNVGNTYYMLDGYDDTNELYLKTTLNTILAPTFAVYYDWDNAKKDGVFLALSVGHTFTPMKNLAINLGALGSYNIRNPSASLNYNDFHNYELSASLDYSLTDALKISPSYIHSNAINSNSRNNGNVHSQNIVGLKATFAF